MPSLRRIPKSPYWIACITLSDGKRTQRSTKQKDKRKAMEIAVEMENAEQEAKEGILTEAQVRKHVSKAYEVATGGKLNFHTIETWLNWWVQNKAKSKRKSTALRYEGTIKTFVKSLGERVKLDIRHLDTTDIEKFRNELITSGKANRTINIDLKTVASALNLAYRNGLIERNPAKALDPLPVEESRKQPFTLAQVRSILLRAEGEWTGICMFGFYTGMRISDITQMKWRNLDFNADQALVRFKETKKQVKHRREIIVPIHPALLKYLIKQKRGREDDFLFPKLQPKGTGGNNGLSQSFKRILRDTGIVKELYSSKKPGSLRRKVSPYGFHSFRHTFKSALANKGVPKEIYDTLTGHAKPSVAEAYVHRETHLLLDAVSKLPNLKVA